MSNCLHYRNGRVPIPIPFLEKKQNLSIMSLVIHGFSATFMYNNNSDRQLSHLELQKKSPDIVFKYETASW